MIVTGNPNQLDVSVIPPFMSRSLTPYSPMLFKHQGTEEHAIPPPPPPDCTLVCTLHLTWSALKLSIIPFVEASQTQRFCKIDGIFLMLLFQKTKQASAGLM